MYEVSEVSFNAFAAATISVFLFACVRAVFIATQTNWRLVTHLPSWIIFCDVRALLHKDSNACCNSDELATVTNLQQ
jgi:hypothetical protein